MFRGFGIGPRGFFGLALPLLVFLQMPGCLELEGNPESARNPVGESHRISTRVDVSGNNDWILIFEVVQGPNVGVSSILGCNFTKEACQSEAIALEEELADECEGVDIEDQHACALGVVGPGECVPTCLGSGDATVSWSYRGTGGPGTDYIVICGQEIDLDLIGTVTTSNALLDGVDWLAGGLSGGLGDEEIEDLEDEGCTVVTKTWEERNGLLDGGGRFVGGGLFAGDLGAAERNRQRAQAAGAAAATPQAAPASAAVRPPSTGDGGLAR